MRPTAVHDAVVVAEALPGMPEIRRGDDLGALLRDAAARLPDPGLRPDDVLAVAHKAVAKAEGRVVPLAASRPAREARKLAAEHGKDPRLVELILAESVELVRADAGRLIARTRHGFVCANAGVDQSNAGGEEHAVLLPVDPDASARALRARLGCAVVITDSFGRAVARSARRRSRSAAPASARSTTGAGAPTPPAGSCTRRRSRSPTRRRRRPTSSAARTRGEPAVRLRGLERHVLAGRRPRRRGPAARAPEQDLLRLTPSAAHVAAAPLLLLDRAAHVEPLPRGLDVRAARQRPAPERAHRRGERRAERRQRVVDPRRHLRVDAAVDQAVALHRAQRLGQDLLRDRLQVAEQLVVAARAVAEGEQHVDAPLGLMRRPRASRMRRA